MQQRNVNHTQKPEFLVPIQDFKKWAGTARPRRGPEIPLKTIVAIFAVVIAVVNVFVIVVVFVKYSVIPYSTQQETRNALQERMLSTNLTTKLLKVATMIVSKCNMLLKEVHINDLCNAKKSTPCLDKMSSCEYPSFFRSKMNLSFVVFSRRFFALSFWFTFCLKDGALLLLFLRDVWTLKCSSTWAWLQNAWF